MGGPDGGMENIGGRRWRSLVSASNGGMENVGGKRMEMVGERVGQWDGECWW